MVLPQETYGTHPRRYIALSITARCNSRCRHCSNWEDGAPVPELPFGDFVKFILDAWETDPSFHVQITGGEPLLRTDDCLQIIKELSAKGIHTHLATNGLLLRGDLPMRLADAGLSSLAISLDGLGHHHDWLRGVPEAFAKAVSAIEQMGQVSDRVRVSVATVLFDKMLEEVETFTGHVLDIPFLSHINFQAIFPDLRKNPEERFENVDGLWPPDPQKAAKAIDQIAAMKQRGMKIKNPFGQLEAMKAYFADPLHLFRKQCNAEQEVLHIAPNGDLRICVYEEPIGNIQTTNYPELIGSQKWVDAIKVLHTCRVNCHSMVNCSFSEE